MPTTRAEWLRGLDAYGCSESEAREAGCVPPPPTEEDAKAAEERDEDD